MLAPAARASDGLTGSRVQALTHRRRAVSWRQRTSGEAASRRVGASQSSLRCGVHHDRAARRPRTDLRA